MIRSGNSSGGGILRVLRSYKSYLFMVLFLYLLVILVFHAQLHVYDGTGVTTRSRRGGADESSPINRSRFSNNHQTFTTYRTPARNTSTTLRFPSPSAKDREPSYDRAFPLITNCLPTFSTNARPRRNGLSFQSVGDHYLYSAYFDDRLLDEPPTIRIIALLKKSDDFQFYCHIPVAVEEGLKGPDGSSTDQESIKDQYPVNEASARYSSHGTVGGNSEKQDGIEGQRNNDEAEHYLKLRYAKLVTEDGSKYEAEAHKDNLNGHRPNHGSNTRIDRKSASSWPIIGDNPKSGSDHDRANYETGDVPTNHHRRTESRPRLRYRTVRASIYEMCENHNKDFGGWILSCALDRHIQQPPCEVLVSMSPYQTHPNASVVSIPVFRVRNTDATDDRKENFGICVPPLFGHIPSTTLVEFVEFSRILGANHIVFYHHQVSREIAKALSYYANRGTVTTIRWDVPVDDKAVWYHGQLLAINDCLYRSMHAFRHVAFNDIDEFVVPHVHVTWKEMVSSFRRSALGLERTSFGTGKLEKSSTLPSDDLRGGPGPIDWRVPQPSKGTLHGSQSLGKSSEHVHQPLYGSTRGPLFHGDGTDYAGYSFQSAFFDPLLSGLISHVMYDLESDLRTKTFSKVRSKVMVRPEAIFELGIHHVSRLVSEDLTVYHVPTDVAFVHHYRKCISEFDPLMNCQIFAHDESLSRYIPTIRHNIHQTLWCMKEASLTEEAEKLHLPTAASFD